jgi:proteic killer suppression protein
VVRSFRHKGLEELFRTGRSSRVGADLQKRALRRLDALEHAATPRELNIPGFDFHALKGRLPRYSIHVNGPWCITFEWHDGEVWYVDLVQYH